MNKQFEQYIQQIEEDIQAIIPDHQGSFKKLYKAMRYSFLAGGKRIRPLLMRLAYESTGGQGDIITFQAAIEMIHTYSLVHDDLPAMDDDDLRRGRPTNHKQFDEATAILAGDALLNYAYEIMIEEALEEDDMQKIRAASILAKASGARGMVGGQILDIENEGKAIELETLDNIHLHKTGALIAASVTMGGVLAHASSVEVAALEAYGKYLGKVFQIVDDILDVTSNTEHLGKPVDSDKKNDKMTYVSFYTVEECYKLAEELTAKAIDCLKHVSGNTTHLRDLALALVHRTK